MRERFKYVRACRCRSSFEYRYEAPAAKPGGLAKGKAPAGKDAVVAALADLASPDKAGSSFAALAEVRTRTLTPPPEASLSLSLAPTLRLTPTLSLSLSLTLIPTLTLT